MRRYFPERYNENGELIEKENENDNDNDDYDERPSPKMSGRRVEVEDEGEEAKGRGKGRGKKAKKAREEEEEDEEYEDLTADGFDAQSTTRRRSRMIDEPEEEDNMDPMARIWYFPSLSFPFSSALSLSFSFLLAFSLFPLFFSSSLLSHFNIKERIGSG